MTISRVFDATPDVVWKAWTDPRYLMQWWGPKGFTAPVCNIDLRVGGRYLYCMQSPDGWTGWTAGEFYEVVPHKKLVFSMYFADAQGNRVEPEALGIEHKADPNAYDTVVFEDLGDGRTRLTYTGNEAAADAADSGQLEGWNQILDKLAAVVAEVASA